MLGQFRQLPCQRLLTRYMYHKKSTRRHPPACVRLAITSTPLNKCCAIFAQCTPNMPVTKHNKDPRVQKAVKFKLANPNATLPQSMRAAEFTNEESKSAMVQMRVRRQLLKVDKTSLPTQISTGASPASSVSSLTASPALKITQVRHTSKAMQQIRRNNAAKKINKSKAFKMATTMYANEKKKPDDGSKKLSALDVSRIVEQNTGTRIARRTIEENVNAGRVGVSPAKRGRPSSIPDAVFEQMAIALESFLKIKQVNVQGAQGERKKLTRILKQCTSPVLECDVTSLLKRLLNATAGDLKAGRND